MHPADIKAAIAKAGLTQSSLAQRAARPGREHVHKSAVSRVIAGDLKSASLARLISETIDIPVSRLWPGKYPELEFLQATKLLPRPAAKAQGALRHAPSKPTPAKKAARRGVPA